MRAVISGVLLLCLGVVVGVVIGPDVRVPTDDGVVATLSRAPDGTVWPTSPTQATQATQATREAPDVASTLVPATAQRTIGPTVGFGDSLTVIPGSWFRRTCGSSVLGDCVNEGIRGDTTYGMLSRLERDVLTAKPSVVIVMGGTNDLQRGSSPKYILDRLDEIVDRIDATGATAILCTIPPRDRFGRGVLRLNKAIRSYARRGQIPLLDMYNVVGDQRGAFKPRLSEDGVHPDVKGARLMANLAERRLPALLPEVVSRVSTGPAPSPPATRQPTPPTQAGSASAN